MARRFGIPAPVLLSAGGLYLLMFYILYCTPFGRRIYAIGGNIVAARLAGINTTLYMILTYVLCSTIVAFGGILLTARVGTGKSTLAQTHVLKSITAVVLAGVSFFGGIGRVGNVVLGAFFVTLLTNGMNLLRVSSYKQQIVVGCLRIDPGRHRRSGPGSDAAAGTGGVADDRRARRPPHCSPPPRSAPWPMSPCCGPPASSRRMAAITLSTASRSRT